MTTLKPRTHFAGHRVVRLVAVGRVAEVYEVILPDGARRALKILREGLARPAKSEARFGQEAEATAMIDHVHVVRFHDAGVEDGRPWMLVELVEGPDLRVLLRDAGGALPVERAVSLVRQACEGVAAAHAIGVLHRDLKPENLLVAANDLVKVADFGSAKLSGWGIQTTKEEDLGSCLHLAPERVIHRVAEPRSDVYALGIVLYESIAGANPIAPRPATAIEICERQVTVAPPPLASAARDVPGDLSDLVQRALAKDPAARPTAREMAGALAVVLHRLQAPRRAVARAMPRGFHDPALARTEPAMPAHPGGGTIPMPAVPTVPAVHTHREAFPPPAPSPVYVSTLRSPTVADPTPSAPARLDPVLPADRRSTTAPLERAAPRASRVPRAPVLGGLGALIALGLLAAAWLIFLRGDPTPAGPRPSPAASAPAPLADDAGPPAPAPPRHRVSPPRARPHSP